MADTATPLKGRALLQKVKEFSDLPRREVAKRCGYYSVGGNNQTRVNLTDFYEALLAARGIPLTQKGGRDGVGREASYRVTIHKNGQIVIGDSYTREMGLKPGDEFEIRLGHKHIRLIQLESSGEPPEEDSEDEDEE